MKEEAKAEKDEEKKEKKASVWMDIDSRLREEKKDIIHDAQNDLKYAVDFDEVKAIKKDTKKELDRAHDKAE